MTLDGHMGCTSIGRSFLGNGNDDEYKDPRSMDLDVEKSPERMEQLTRNDRSYRDRCNLIEETPVYMKVLPFR
ncbi:hypothetical protein K7432_017316, partial [Basidiobolus ranarum]